MAGAGLSGAGRALRKWPHLSQPRRSASNSSAAAASGAPSSTLQTTRATRSPPPCARARARPLSDRPCARALPPPALTLCCHAVRSLSGAGATVTRLLGQTMAPLQMFACTQETSKRAKRAGSTSNATEPCKLHKRAPLSRPPHRPAHGQPHLGACALLRRVQACTN